MQYIRTRVLPMLLAVAVAAAAAPARADDACLDFKWDVSKERALFAEAPAALPAGKDSRSAPVVVPNRLYKLELMARDNVVFSAPPGKENATQPTYAGLAALRISAPGSYRIAVDVPLWIDLVSNGSLVHVGDFQGQHECSAPHKILVYELPEAKRFMLQFSNATGKSVLFTVTATPTRKL
jgi:hypothetical protein